jgi:DnaJ-domain-containing protein 1
VNRDRLVFGLASVFAGLTVLSAVLALAESPLFLVLAFPFGTTTYVLWYQASGRLRERTRRRVAQGRDRERHSGFGAGARREATRGARRDGRTGPGPGPDWEKRRRRGRSRRANANRRRARGGGAGTGRSGLSRAEAYRALGLDRDADADDVRRAYRSKVKEVHPDTEGGDEESFKRVNRAYERLTD